jgi:hypothetical protein
LGALNLKNFHLASHHRWHFWFFLCGVVKYDTDLQFCNKGQHNFWHKLILENFSLQWQMCHKSRVYWLRRCKPFQQSAHSKVPALATITIILRIGSGVSVEILPLWARWTNLLLTMTRIGEEYAKLAEKRWLSVLKVSSLDEFNLLSIVL